MSLVRREMVSQNSFNANDSTGALKRRTSANDGANNYTSQFASGDVDSLADSSRLYNPPSSSFSTPKQNGVERSGLADFFSGEVFRIVLHNPTTAHRLKKFSQARMCGENMEFLEQVMLAGHELATTMTEIYYSFTGPDAPKQLGVPTKLMRKINADIKTSTTSTLPSMENIFSDAQENVEHILRTSIYPRFVKYQMTHSASKALSTDRSRFQGLGDCFVLTDPK
ncbi:MAG: hypothetical protein Q9214_006941 [Letrouitia sp. 1 TL-2023]